LAPTRFPGRRIDFTDKVIWEYAGVTVVFLVPAGVKAGTQGVSITAWATPPRPYALARLRSLRAAFMRAHGYDDDRIAKQLCVHVKTAQRYARSGAKLLEQAGFVVTTHGIHPADLED
jgi:hypothetical protein